MAAKTRRLRELIASGEDRIGLDAYYRIEAETVEPDWAVR